jgi:PAS domain S-box-containing protein
VKLETLPMKVDSSLRLYTFSAILLTLVIFVSALFLLISAGKSQDGLIELHLDHSKHLRELEVTFMALAPKSRTAAFSVASPQINDILILRQQFNESLTHLREKHSAGDWPKVTEAIAQAESEFTKSIDQLVLLNKNDLQTRLRFYEAEVSPKRIAVDRLINAAVAKEEDEFYRAITDSRKSRNRATGILGVIGTLGLVFGFAFYILLSRSIFRNRKIKGLLTASEHLSQQAIRIAGLGIFDRDHQKNTVSVSERLREIYDWPRDKEFAVEDWMSLIHPDDREKVNEKLKRSQNSDGDGSHESEYRVVTPTKRVKWTNVIAQTYYEKGVPIRTRGVISDITEAKEREEALAKSKDFIQKILDVSPTMIAVLDVHTMKVRFASPSISRVLGYSTEEICGMESIFLVTHPDDLEKAQAFYSSLADLKEGEVAEYTRRLRHKNGEWIYIFSRCSAFARDAEGKVTQILSAATDVTSMKMLEFKLEKSNRELEQFAGIAAHDLTAPLKSIYSWIDVLDEIIPEPRSLEAERAIQFLKQNSKRADSMVTSLLELARINSDNSTVEQIELNSMMDNLLEILKLDIQGASAKIQVGKLPEVRGHSHAIESVFSNLIRNALVYREKNRESVITIGSRERADCYEFFVKDNGIGIDSQNLKTIFEMFKRLHSGEYPGSGIGLAYCKRVVETYGGNIWVESDLGKGSTFYFTYPKHANQMSA